MARDVIIHAAGESPSWPTLTRFADAVHSSGRYFVDQYGDPYLIRGDTPWAIMSDLSTADMATYVTDRAAKGCNSLYFSAVAATGTGGQADDGRTYDNILPFSGGDITSLNEAYWARLDYLIGLCEDNGITVWLNIYDGWTGSIFGGFGAASYESYGAQVAERYADARVVWMFGGDYFPSTSSATSPDAADAARGSMVTGIRSTGDTRPYTVQLGYQRSLTSDNPYWARHAEANFGYSYFASYDVILDGYAHSWDTAAGKPATRPIFYGEGEYDGYYDGGNGNTLTMRRQVCWSMTSGGCGHFTGQEGVWNFLTGWESVLANEQIDQIKAGLDVFEGIDWWKLVPDTGSSLVTAGRGTKYTFTSNTDNQWNTLDSYVTAGVAGDGTLAVIFMPNAASAITVDWTPMGSSGRTATWVDPSNGATVAATAGATSYSRSTANSAGDADWLLILTAD